MLKKKKRKEKEEKKRRIRRRGMRRRRRRRRRSRRRRRRRRGRIRRIDLHEPELNMLQPVSYGLTIQNLIVIFIAVYMNSILFTVRL